MRRAFSAFVPLNSKAPFQNPFRDAAQFLDRLRNWVPFVTGEYQNTWAAVGDESPLVVQVIPEPGPFALVGLGAGALWILRQRRKGFEVERSAFQIEDFKLQRERASRLKARDEAEVLLMMVVDGASKCRTQVRSEECRACASGRC